MRKERKYGPSAQERNITGYKLCNYLLVSLPTQNVSAYNVSVYPDTIFAAA